MKVYTKREKDWNIEFEYSPLFELLCSAHVIVKPDHHLERIAWAKTMQSKIPPKLLENIVAIGKRTFDWCAIMDLCNIYEECNDFNTMDALHFLNDLSVEEYTKIFARYPQFEMRDFDERYRDEMVNTLKEYYLGFFERELRFLEPLLVRCLRRDSELFESLGLMDYAKKLHSRIEVTENAFLFHKHTLYTIPFDGLRRVIIRISSFIDPHLLMDYGKDMVQFTIRAHLDKGTDEVPRDTLGLLKALADETRLRVLRLLYREEASTQKLARELNLTEACISKHLKILYDSGLLYRERTGSFVNYYLNASLLEKIPLSISEYLDFSINA